MYQDTPQPAASPSEAPLSHEEYQDLAQRLFPSAAALAAALDHTLLKPEATHAQVLELAAQAAEHHFACAMVNPVWVPTVQRALVGTGVRTGSVLGFPLGSTLRSVLCFEARAAARAGARDLDMVMHVGGLLSGMFREVRDDIQAVGEVAHGEGAILKVILETSLLDRVQKRTAAELCVEAGADFVKTSTGFSAGGATEEDVRLLRDTVGAFCGVKASGGIRTLEGALRMAAAGADRLGVSASVAILEAYKTLCPPAPGEKAPGMTRSRF